MRTLLAVIQPWLAAQGFEFAVLFAHHPKIYASSGYQEVDNLFYEVIAPDGQRQRERGKESMVAVTGRKAWPAGDVQIAGPKF